MCERARERERERERESLQTSQIEKMAAKKHHGSTIVTFLCPSAELPTAELPTLQDILKQCQLLPERFKQHLQIDSAQQVLPLYLIFWNRTNAKLVQLPIRQTDKVLVQLIVDKIEREWTTLLNIAIKNGKVQKREKTTFLAELELRRTL